MAYDLFLHKTDSVPPQPCIVLLVRDGQGCTTRQVFKRLEDVSCFVTALCDLTRGIPAWWPDRLPANTISEETARGSCIVPPVWLRETSGSGENGLSRL